MNRRALQIHVGGHVPEPREHHDYETSYNGGATTTILFPRMAVHTGSDATIGTTVHAIEPLPSGRAARLRKIFIAPDSDNTWGVSSLWLFSVLGPSPVAYTCIGMLHTAAIPSGGAAVDFWSEGGVPFTKVWIFDESLGTYAEETTNMQDIGLNDVTLLPATEAALDRTIFSHTAPFDEISLSSKGGTAGVGGTGTWKYTNDGTTWIALADVVDETAGFTAALGHGQRVRFTKPAGWTAAAINGAAALYSICFEVATTYSTNPVYSNGYVKAPHTIPARHVAVVGLNTNGAAHGDTRLTMRFEAA